jgi:hypothetical protein
VFQLGSLDLKTNSLLETQLDRFVESGFYANECRLQIAAMNNQIMIFDPEVIVLISLLYF